MEIEVGRERPVGRLPERDREPYVRAETVADPLRRLRAAEVVRADLADHHMLRSYVAELRLVPVQAPVVVPAEEVQILRVGQVRLRVLDENLMQPGRAGFSRPEVQEVRQRGGHGDRLRLITSVDFRLVLLTGHRRSPGRVPGAGHGPVTLLPGVTRRTSSRLWNRLATADRPGITESRSVPRNRHIPTASTAHPTATAQADTAPPLPSSALAASGTMKKPVVVNVMAIRVPRPNGCSRIVTATWVSGIRLVIPNVTAQPMAAPVMPYLGRSSRSRLTFTTTAWTPLTRLQLLRPLVTRIMST